MIFVKDLFKKYGERLELTLLSKEESLLSRIKKPEVHRPGLCLAGFLKESEARRILVFGRSEINYIRSLSPSIRCQRLRSTVTPLIPAVIVSRNQRVPKEVTKVCEDCNIALFKTPLRAMDLITKLTLLLADEFCPMKSVHGTLVEVFGVGVLIQGDSSVGKSETALGLIEKGHRLISDDIVKIRKKENSYLVGFGPELTRHMMEIRGIGIINVAHLYGAVCVRHEKVIDVVVQIELWDDQHFYDRVGLEEKYQEILDVALPLHTLPVKPGRDVVLLLETIALNHRLKVMGYNSAKEFKAKLLHTITMKQKTK